MDRNIKTGTYTGDGTNSITVDLAFRPKFVQMINVTDGDTKIEVYDDGIDGKCFSIVLATAALTSNPPKILSRGFSTGTNALVIESAKVYLWTAIG